MRERAKRNDPDSCIIVFDFVLALIRRWIAQSLVAVHALCRGSGITNTFLEKESGTASVLVVADRFRKVPNSIFVACDHWSATYASEAGTACYTFCCDHKWIHAAGGYRHHNSCGGARI